MIGTNGKLLILQYKYGDRQDLFETYEKALQLVEQYPILYSVVPEDMKDKKMTLAFVRANGRCISRYQEILSQIRENDAKLMAEGVVSRGWDKLLLQEKAELQNNAFVGDNMFDLGIYTKDSEILTEAMLAGVKGTWFFSEVGGFLLNPANYDEKVLAQTVKAVPQTICRIYEYWNQYIGEFPKVKKSVMVRYRLRNEPSDSEIAFFKSFGLAEKNNLEALNFLFQNYTVRAEAQLNEDHREEVRSLFIKLSPEIQNNLIAGNYRYVKYAKKGVLQRELQEEIIKDCPIAGDLLPDAAVLQYDLSQSESDEEALEKCKKCKKCVFFYLVSV